jgi:hypothetical protein
MHRTEGANYAAGSLGNEFTNGPPGTTITDDWLNAVQEEIAAVIEAAGLTLKTASTETSAQLKAALLVGYANKVMNTGIGFDFSADSKGVFKGMTFYAARMGVTITNADDPLGATGGEWILCAGTESETSLGSDGPSVIGDIEGNAGNGVFNFLSTGYWFVFHRAFIGNNAGADIRTNVSLFASNDNGGVWTKMADTIGNIYVATARTTLSGAPGLLKIQNLSGASQDLVKLVWAPATGTSWVSGSATSNDTAIFFLKIADL